MQKFCRTCGKTLSHESSIPLFLPSSKPLLNSARTITNCWLENAPGYPNFMCKDCEEFLEKVQRFRRRCAKIQYCLSRCRAKLGGQLAFAQDLSVDPLRIEDIHTAEIKAGTSLACSNIDTKKEQLADLSRTDQTHKPQNHFLMPKCSIKDEVNVDSNQQQLNIDSAKLLTEKNAFISQAEESARIKPTSRMKKSTCRVGRRLIHLRVTNDAQPKRIVDPQRQWAQPCICEHCGREFKDVGKLNVHLLRHTGTKNFECEQCHQKCYTLHLLRRHQLKHTEGPYCCSFCGEQYSTNSSRVRHERESCKKGRAPGSKTAIIKRGERTFHCSVCDIWFLRAGNLAQHINSANHMDNEQRKRRKNKEINKKMLNSLKIK